MNWFKSNWYILLAITLLLGSLWDHPYSYYQLLRWVVSFVGFYSAYVAHIKGNSFWMWVFIALGVLFNPIRPFYLEKETWQVLDVVGGAVLFASLFANKK